jgi:hypothetical protein
MKVDHSQFVIDGHRFTHQPTGAVFWIGKIDAILLAVDPNKGGRLVDAIDREYEGRHTDARFVRLLERRAAS